MWHHASIWLYTSALSLFLLVACKKWQPSLAEGSLDETAELEEEEEEAEENAEPAEPPKPEGVQSSHRLDNLYYMLVNWMQPMYTVS